MRTRFTLFILLCTAFLGAASFFSLLYYFDPYSNIQLAVLLIVLSFILMFTSFFSLILYFIKKIYYRGSVGMVHIMSSVRQSFLLVLCIIGAIIGVSFGIPILLPLFILMGVLILVELFFQTFV